MAHAFETIEQYEELAKQCEVQGSFVTSPVERVISSNKQRHSAIWPDLGRHRLQMRHMLRTPIEPNKTGQRQAARKKERFTKSQDEKAEHAIRYSPDAPPVAHSNALPEKFVARVYLLAGAPTVSAT